MKTQQQNKKLLLILSVAVVAMFGFGFALVPLYNVFCDITGLNGRIDTSQVASATPDNTVDHHRVITVQFLATNNDTLPWKFYPMTESIKVHPGEVTRISYFAKNNASKSMTIQAVPSVTPGLAAQYIKKTECFCFTQQTLGAGQAMTMPVLFHVDKSVPTNIHTITLSYTLFDTQAAPIKQAHQGKIHHDTAHH